jgi:F-type H+-transporting ATPase subunit epsilon
MAGEMLPFKLITPTGVMFDAPVREVTAVNLIGEFGVLPQHINFITALVPCVIAVTMDNGETRLFVVSGGLVEVKDGVMTVLASTAERAEDVADGVDVSREVVDAEEKLRYMSYYEPNYEGSVRNLQLARARERASQLRTRPR